LVDAKIQQQPVVITAKGDPMIRLGTLEEARPVGARDSRPVIQGTNLVTGFHLSNAQPIRSTCFGFLDDDMDSRPTQQGPSDFAVVASVSDRPEFLATPAIERQYGLESIAGPVVPSVDDITTTVSGGHGFVDTTVKVPEFDQGTKGLGAEQVADAADARRNLEVVLPQRELPSVQ